MAVRSDVLSVWAYFAAWGTGSVLLARSGVVEVEGSSGEEIEGSRERFAMLVRRRYGELYGGCMR